MTHLHDVIQSFNLNAVSLLITPTSWDWSNDGPAHVTCETCTLTVYVLTMYRVLTMYVLTMYVLTVYVWATHLLHAYCGWTAASEAPPCLTNRSRATLVTEPPRDSNYCCSTRSSHSAATGRCPRWWRHLVATCPSCSLALGSRRVAATFRPAAWNTRRVTHWGMQNSWTPVDAGQSTVHHVTGHNTYKAQHT